MYQLTVKYNPGIQIEEWTFITRHLVNVPSGESVFDGHKWRPIHPMHEATQVSFSVLIRGVVFEEVLVCEPGECGCIAPSLSAARLLSRTTTMAPHQPLVCHECPVSVSKLPYPTLPSPHSPSPSDLTADHVQQTHCPRSSPRKLKFIQISHNFGNQNFKYKLPVNI